MPAPTFATAILTLLLAAAPVGHAQNSATFRASATLPGARSAFLPTLFPSNHAANLLQLRNGDVLCFWFSGTAEGQGNVAIVVSRLPNGSDTWGPTQLVDRDPADSYQNPVPFEAPDGTIWLLHTRQSANQGQAGAQVLKLVSTDGGHTWSKPAVLFARRGAFDRQPIVVGDRGEWILPLYYSTTPGIVTGADTNYSVVEISRDQGRTWSETPVPGSEGLVQMCIVRQARGRYVAFFRSRYADFIYRAFSSDGMNWSKPVPTLLPNNNASIQAAALAGGSLVMAFDNARGPKPGRVPQTGPRAPLSLALSPDGGLTWPYVRDLETPSAEKPSPTAPASEAGEYSYPSVLQLADGRILTAYTFRRAAIKSVLASVPWIGAGTTVGLFRPAPVPAP